MSCISPEVILYLIFKPSCSRI